MFTMGPPVEPFLLAEDYHNKESHEQRRKKRKGYIYFSKPAQKIDFLFPPLSLWPSSVSAIVHGSGLLPGFRMEVKPKQYR